MSFSDPTIIIGRRSSSSSSLVKVVCLQILEMNDPHIICLISSILAHGRSFLIQTILEPSPSFMYIKFGNLLTFWQCQYKGCALEWACRCLTKKA